AADQAFTDFQRQQPRFDRSVRAAATGVAHGGRAVEQVAGGEHAPQLVFIAGGHHQHVGDAAQVGQVEAAGVGRAVFANQAGAVDGEQHIQMLHHDVVDQLVVSALEEGGVNRYHRLGAFAGHAGGQGHRVLLGDGDVEVA